jgi:hypothetical protein
MKTPVICFSRCGGFPSVATRRDDGQIDRCIGFALKTTATSWTPTPSQWRSIKAAVCTEDTIWWRLEGKQPTYGKVFGPVRNVFFDCGEIADLDVEPSHDKGGDEAVWPDKTTPPEFSWTYDGSGVAPAALMTYFRVDISTDGDVPLRDRAKTLTVGGSGTKVWSYTLTAAQWKKVRQLATKGNGMLYWRVRGKDAGRVLECASAVKPLAVDGGTLLLTPFKLTNSPCTAVWSHTEQGAVAYKYYLQFSPDDSFDRKEGWIVTMPGAGTLDAVYTLPKSKQMALLKRAQHPKSGVAAVYCRVRAEDANKASVTYSNTIEVWP